MYGWLDADTETITSSADMPCITDTDCSLGLLSTSKLIQTVGYLSLQVAAKLRAEARLHEAYDTYRYALEIFEDHPPGTRLSVYVFTIGYSSKRGFV